MRTGKSRERKTVAEALALLVGELVPAHDGDALALEGGADLLAVDAGLHRHQLVGDVRDLVEDLARLEARRRAHGDAGGDAALEPGDADHEELVEVRGEDREVAAALEERDVLVGGELEDALVELQPADLAVEEAVGGQALRVLGGARPARGRTNRPLVARGWWERVSLAEALAIETSLTMCASAEASAAVSRALACSSSSTFVSVLMPQSCQVVGEGVLAVDRRVGEAEPLVGAPGGGVVAVDVELDLGQALPGEVGEAEGGQGTTEAPALVVGVDAHDVHLTRGGAGLDLRPVEGDDLPRGVVLDEEEARGVEPRLLHPFVEVGDGEAALFRVRREGRRIERDPRLVIAAGLEGADGEPLRQNRIRAVVVGEWARHPVEAAGQRQPGRRRQRLGGGEEPVRPDAARALGEGGVEEGAAVPGPAVSGVDDELGHGVGGPGRGDLRVPDDGPVVVAAEEVDDALALGTDGEPERLGHGADPVGLGRARPQAAQLVGGGGVDLEQPLGAAHLSPRPRRSCRRPRGRSGSRRCAPCR